MDVDPKDASDWCALGDAWVSKDQQKALEYYERAFLEARSDPHVLNKYLECKIGLVGNINFIPQLFPSLEGAVSMCWQLVKEQAYLPQAFFNVGFFSLLLNRPYESLAAYARAVTLSNDLVLIKTALKSIEKLEKPVLRSVAEMPDLCNMDWALEAVRRFLLTAMATKAQQLETGTVTTSGITRKELIRRRQEFEDLVSTNLSPIEDPIVFVVGGCDASIEEEIKKYEKDLQMAFEDFKGIIISGGTTAGISGLMGNLIQNSRGTIRGICHLPLQLSDEKLHEGYEMYKTREIVHEEVRSEPLTKITALDPLQSWIDLIAAGVNAFEVKVLGINGGEISAFEYRMALAFGAMVGLVESSGRSVTEMKAETVWWTAPSLIWLPRDKMTLRAFVNPGLPSMSKEQIERAAQAIHETFLEENRHRARDATMVPWKTLRRDLKESNRQQAAYAEQILNKAGYGIREAKAKIKFPRFSKSEIETMAEMEHGRWVAERLHSGWTHGPQRDPENKISPYLVSWEELPDEIREYDRQNIRNFPEILSKAGLEVFRLKRGG